MGKPKPQLEYRIYGTPEQQRVADENWNAIEGMEERKQAVLARCRAEKAARR